MREPFTKRGIARPDRGSEAVGGIVRDAYRFVGIAYAYYRRHRTEGLLAEGRHVPADIRQDGRPEEIALTRKTLATGQNARARPDRLIDLALERVQQVPARERTDLGFRIHRVADDEVLDSLGEAPLELGGDRVLDDETLGGDARLAIVLISGPNGRRRGRLQVGVPEDDVRIRPAELEHGLLEGAPCELGDA